MGYNEEDVWGNLLPKIPQTEGLRALALALYQRRGEGTICRRSKVAIGDWQPQMHRCTWNVDTWVHHNPTHRRVYGYLYFDFDRYLDHVRFQPHCVVEIEDGSLVDITPHDSEGDYPFIRHVGTDEEFLAALDSGPLDHGFR